MSEQTLGQVGWFDLTVPDADNVRDFYEAVVGWESESHNMGDYSDYVMKPSGGEALGGICHARGANANLPAQWLMYISVENLEASLTEVRERGGQVVSEPRSIGGYGTVAVIQDPAGAVCAIIQPA